MPDTISITGTVATDPRHSITGTGLPLTRFRLASSQRRYDRATAAWVDAPTNWFSVSTFGAMAMNAATSLHKGERVVLRGRLQVRDWDNGEKKGTDVEVVAESIGHDLLWGTTLFTRTAAAPGKDEALAVTEAAGEPARAVDGWAVPGTDAEATNGELSDVPF